MELNTGERSEETEEKEDSKQTEEDISENKDSFNSSSNSDSVLALPKVRKKAEEAGIVLASIKTGERITEEEFEDYISDKSTQEKPEEFETSSDSRISATPSVRKLARDKEVDISKVEGSGRGGKITRRDVLDFQESPEKEEEHTESAVSDKETQNKTRQSTSHSVSSTGGEVERVEMSGVKKKTAEKMSESRFTAPHVTHVEKADLTELKELREEQKESVKPHLTYLPFIMKAVEEALKDYPKLNAELDTENDEMVYKKYYDFNIAVDTEDGLMIPKIENVDEKSILDLASEIGEKAEKAKKRDLSPKELKNGTFSITNLGVIGGEEFTPIINYPQTAILGIGRIGETAEVIDGEIRPRTTVKLSLSYDHRVVDGATAARFMNEVVENLEIPERMLLKL